MNKTPLTAWKIALVALMPVFGIRAQAQTLQLAVTSVDSASCNDLVTVDVKVTSGFNDLVGLSFSLNWDESTLQYQSFTVLPIGSANPAVNTSNALTAGELTYAWFDPLAFSGEDLLDGTTLMSVVFKIVGSDSPAAALITGSPTPVDAYDFNFSSVPVAVQNNVAIELTPVSGTLGADPVICAGDSLALFSWSATSGMPVTYSIDFDSTATAAGFVDIVDDSLPAGPIAVPVPAGAGAGVYHAVFRVKNELGCASVDKTIGISLTVPVFSFCPQNITTVNDPNACGAVPNWPAPVATSNCGIAAIVPDSLPPGNLFPPGSTQVVYIATDSFGNTATCSFTVTVTDNQAPAPVCFAAAVFFDAGGTAILQATAIDGGSTDNCGIAALAVSHGFAGAFPVDSTGNPVNSLSFDCDYDTPQLIWLWARDAAGNTAHCEVFVLLVDTLDLCNPWAVSFNGELLTETGNGVEDAMVELILDAPPNPPAIMVDLSDNAGHFLFSNVAPAGLNAFYSIRPEKNDNPLNGVTTFDLVLISKHILGLQLLDSPYKIIAADANRSNSVTTFDIVEHRKLILGIYNQLPNNKSWRFVDKNYVFPDPANPFLEAFPESRSDTIGPGMPPGNDFVGLKTGDVNGSAISNGFSAADIRLEDPLLFNVRLKSLSSTLTGVIGMDALYEVTAGAEYALSFSTGWKALAYQFTLELSNLEILDVIPGPGLGPDNFGVFADAVTVSVDVPATLAAAPNTAPPPPDFTLVFRAKTNGALSDMLSVSSRITKAEAYRVADSESRTATVSTVNLRFTPQQPNSPTHQQPVFELFRNTPNPWRDRTQIWFYLPEAGEVVLTVSDVSGRVLYRRAGQFDKGYRSFQLDASQISESGLFYYTVSTAGGSKSLPMVR